MSAGSNKSSNQAGQRWFPLFVTSKRSNVSKQLNLALLQGHYKIHAFTILIVTPNEFYFYLPPWQQSIQNNSCRSRSAMFIKIRYGDDLTLLCNPDCSVANLLENIKSRINLSSDETIDLSDEKGLKIRSELLRQCNNDVVKLYFPGNLTDLSSKPHEIASNHLKSSESNTFVPIRIRKTTEDGSGDYDVLLNNQKELLPDFILSKHITKQESPESEFNGVRKTKRKENATKKTRSKGFNKAQMPHRSLCTA